jgi:sec-independent protein translocase protein TatB
MFGMGMGELLLILVVALLFVGPDKLPSAARSIGKGIRDFRKHSRDLQSTLEQDEKLGEAVRELRSALRDEPLRPRPAPPLTPLAPQPTPGGELGAGPPPPPSPVAASEDGAPVVTPAAGAVAKDRPGSAGASGGGSASGSGGAKADDSAHG